MERKIKFVEGEFYHVFSRGVEKRKVFLEKKDYERFLALMYILNQEDHFHVSNFLNKGQNSIYDLYKQKRGESIVSIFAYSLMSNHIHLAVQEIKEGGISKFMMRLLTAYSMYFNIKYERTGPLFVHPFRSQYIDNDRYFQYLFDYIHLNCLDLHQKDWKELGFKNKKLARNFLESYHYSSYLDFLSPNKRIESAIISSGSELISRATLDIFDYKKDGEFLRFQD